DRFVHLSRDCKFVAVFTRDPSRKIDLGVNLWHLDGVTPRLLISDARARGADFHRNGHHVAIVDADGSIGLFELPSGQEVGRLAPHTLAREVQIALHPTELVVAVCSYFTPVVQVRDLQSGEVVASLPQGSNPGGVAWHPDGRTLAIALPWEHSIHLY